MVVASATDGNVDKTVNELVKTIVSSPDLALAALIALTSSASLPAIKVSAAAGLAPNMVDASNRVRRFLLKSLDWMNVDTKAFLSSQGGHPADASGPGGNN